MKSNLRKLTLFTACAGALLLAFPLRAEEVGPTAGQSQVLAAQVNVTRDALQQVLAKLKSTGDHLDDGMAHADFLAKSRIFSDRVNAAMTTFENTMSTRILKLASVWVDRMQKIEASPAYSAEQKRMVLRDQYAQAKVQFEELSVEYQRALAELYSAALPRLSFTYQDMDRSTSFCGSEGPARRIFDTIIGSNGFRRCTDEIELRFDMAIMGGYGDEAYQFERQVLKMSEFTDDMKRLPDKGWLYLSAFDDDEVNTVARRMHPYTTEPKYFPELAKRIMDRSIAFGCHSASCIPLYASQLTSFISLVRSTLDKTISFPTSQGNLELKGIDKDTQPLLAYLNTDQGIVRNLAFEISDAENRAATIGELATVVLDKDADFERCPSSATRLTELLCRAEEVPGRGCLSTVEKSDLASQIDKLRIRDKAKQQRKACLEPAAPNS